MAAITKAAAADVKPLRGAIFRRGTLGAAVTAPSPVTLQSDGKWDPTDTSTAQLSVAIALQSGGDGDVVDLVVFGPVECLSGATIGSAVYGADAAGGFETAVGTTDLLLGYAETATILFFDPQILVTNPTT